MQLSVSGWSAVVLVSAALAAACGRAVPARVARVELPAPVFTPAAIPACPLSNGATLWLPGAEQFLSYCDTTIELRDAANGRVRAQREVTTPGSGGGIRSAVVSPDGSHLALHVDDHVEVRELPSLNLLWRELASPTFLRFSSHGRELLLSDDLAFSAGSGQRVPVTPSSVAERWRGSPQLNAAGTLVFEAEQQSGLTTVRDALKDTALQSFELPDGQHLTPIWVGPYLGYFLSGGLLLVDARDPKRRFSLKSVLAQAPLQLSSDGSRLRSVQRDQVLEWRLGEASPAVLVASSARRVWLGAGVRVESTDSALTLWRQTATGERLARRYWAHPQWVEIGPTGEVVARDDSPPRLLLLGAEKEREIALAPGEEPSLLAFEPNGGRFVTAAASKLRVYQAQARQAQQTIDLPLAPSALAWRAEPPELLVADAEHLYAVALATGKVTPFGDFARVLRIAVSRDGNGVAVVALRDEKPELTLISKSGEEHQALAGALHDVRFSPDGKTLWVLEKGSLLTLHLSKATGTPARTERKPIYGDDCRARLTPPGEVYCMDKRLRVATASGKLSPEPEPVALQPAWSAQGLVLTSRSKQQAPQVVTFPAGIATPLKVPQSPPQPAKMPELPLQSSDVRAWASNKAGSALAILDGNATVNTFSTTGRLLARLTESASALLSSEDASTLVTVAADATSLTVWDTKTWQPRVEVPAAERISDVAVSKDGARVAVLNGHGSLDVVSGDRSQRHYDLRREIAARGLAFDPSGQYLALGGLPFRILRLSDGAVLYGYAATVEPQDPIVLAWLSESGAVAGDLSVLRTLPFPGSQLPGAFTKRQTPHIFQAFFDPAPP